MLVSSCLTSAGDGRVPGVGVAVGLDHERRATRDERGRLAGAAELLDRRAVAGEVGALLVDVDVCAAQRPADLTRRHQIELTAVLGGPADSIEEMLSLSQLWLENWKRVRLRLRVAAEVGARARGDHGRVAGRRSRALDSTPESPRALHHGDAGGRRPAR